MQSTPFIHRLPTSLVKIWLAAIEFYYKILYFNLLNLIFIEKIKLKTTRIHAIFGLLRLFQLPLSAPTPTAHRSALRLGLPMQRWCPHIPVAFDLSSLNGFNPRVKFLFRDDGPVAHPSFIRIDCVDGVAQHLAYLLAIINTQADEGEDA